MCPNGWVCRQLQVQFPFVIRSGLSLLAVFSGRQRHWHSCCEPTCQRVPPPPRASQKHFRNEAHTSHTRMYLQAASSSNSEAKRRTACHAVPCSTAAGPQQQTPSSGGGGDVQQCLPYVIVPWHATLVVNDHIDELTIPHSHPLHFSQCSFLVGKENGVVADMSLRTFTLSPK
jgi:hypothetical protein